MCAKSLICRHEGSLDTKRYRAPGEYLRIHCSQLSNLCQPDGGQNHPPFRANRRSAAIGRKVPEYQTEDIRELIEKPYRIIYRIKANQIDVLAVIHGARLLPEEI